MTLHQLKAVRETLHGTFHKSRPPVLRVQDGDRIAFETLEVGWRTERVRPGRKLATVEPRDAVLDNGPALTGPVFVEGAEPGMTLELRFLRFTPQDWGWTSAGGSASRIDGLGVEELEKASVLWSLEPEEKRVVNQWGHSVALKPFLGTVGLASSDDLRQPGWFPHPRTGGNLDASILVEGTSLFLPVEVTGGLLSVGDAHAAQGDGEVGGTAIECPMREALLEVRLHPDLAIGAPRALCEGRWATFGVAPTLDAAARAALNEMLDLLEVQCGWTRPQALAMSSCLVDLRITQMVNPLMGVHAMLKQPLEELTCR